jgi:hypothetical protein
VKKLWLGLGLLAALLALGLGSLGMLAARSARAGAVLAQAAEAAGEGDMARAADLAARAQALWQGDLPAVDAVTSHEETDEICRALAELRSLGRSGKREEFLALCARLEVMAAHLAEMERPRWYNIL